MNKLSRRDLLRTSAAYCGFLLLPRLALGQGKKSANSTLNVALIGGGGIAKTCFRDCEDENVIAIADVDDVAGAEGFEKFPRAITYKDFRRMLDRHAKELDAVIVSTPDHTHFPATYAAMERGIAVHTQKPLTHNIWQARTLQKAAHKFGVQTVMGNQGHNMEGMRLIKERRMGRGEWGHVLTLDSAFLNRSRSVPPTSRNRRTNWLTLTGHDDSVEREGAVAEEGRLAIARELLSAPQVCSGGGEGTRRPTFPPTTGAKPHFAAGVGRMEGRMGSRLNP